MALKPQQFYNDFGFIMGFVLLVLLMDTLVSSKASQAFIAITLLSMVVLNSEKFQSFLSEHFTLKKESDK